jgi:hypothetical protein
MSDIDTRDCIFCLSLFSSLLVGNRLVVVFSLVFRKDKSVHAAFLFFDKLQV